jgi:hypothetical protein
MTQIESSIKELISLNEEDHWNFISENKEKLRIELDNLFSEYYKKINEDKDDKKVKGDVNLWRHGLFVLTDDQVKDKMLDLNRWRQIKKINAQVFLSIERSSEDLDYLERKLKEIYKEKNEIEFEKQKFLEYIVKIIGGAFSIKEIKDLPDRSIYRVEDHSIIEFSHMTKIEGSDEKVMLSISKCDTLPYFYIGMERNGSVAKLGYCKKKNFNESFEQIINEYLKKLEE